MVRRIKKNHEQIFKGQNVSKDGQELFTEI